MLYTVKLLKDVSEPEGFSKKGSVLLVPERRKRILVDELKAAKLYEPKHKETKNV
jgi:hypothetical protein